MAKEKTKAPEAPEVLNTEDEQETKKQKLTRKEKKELKKIEKDRKKGKKKKHGIIPLLLIAVIVGALVAIFGFNAGNIREKYFRPILQNVPVVKNLLPEQTEDDAYAMLSKNELINENKALLAENEKLNSDIDALNNSIDSLNTEMIRLREIESQQLQYRAEKDEFDRMIAMNDPDAYSAFYESVDPENAERLYQEAIQSGENDKELKQYVQTFEGMKKSAAAKVLGEMIGSDMDLVVRILNNISSEQRGNILAEMDPKDAAACARQMAP